jgi:hypothetical protein
MAPEPCTNTHAKLTRLPRMCDEDSGPHLPKAYVTPIFGAHDSYAFDALLLCNQLENTFGYNRNEQNRRIRCQH